MAKSNTEANQKKASNNLKKIKGDVPYERPFIDPPPEDIEVGKDLGPTDPGPLSEKEKLSGADLDRKMQRPKIEITKGKLLKGDKVEIEYTKQDSPESKPAECSEKHTDPPRKEFVNAFKSLAVHAALIGEFIPLVSIDIDNPDSEQIKDFTVTGFSIHDAGEDDEAVILTAHKTLKSGKALGFNTPLLRINDESENAYPHLDELSESIDLCKQEIRLYLNGKHAPDPQGKLFE